MCIIGRASGYRPDYVRLAFNYCRLGATRDRLPALFGVSAATIERWLAAVPEFAKEVWRGSRLADAEVAGNLHRLATGYDRQVERVMMWRGEARVVTYTKHYPPNPRACIRRWLIARQPSSKPGIEPRWSRAGAALRELAASRRSRPRSSLTFTATGSINDQPSVRILSVSPKGCGPPRGVCRKCRKCRNSK
jgi:hypothetical protein